MTEQAQTRQSPSKPAMAEPMADAGSALGADLTLPAAAFEGGDPFEPYNLMLRPKKDQPEPHGGHGSSHGHGAGHGAPKAERAEPASPAASGVPLGPEAAPEAWAPRSKAADAPLFETEDAKPAAGLDALPELDLPEPEPEPAPGILAIAEPSDGRVGPPPAASPSPADALDGAGPARPPAPPTATDAALALARVDARDLPGLEAALAAGPRWPQGHKWSLGAYCAMRDWPEGVLAVHRAGMAADAPDLDGVSPAQWALATKSWRALAALASIGAPMRGSSKRGLVHEMLAGGAPPDVFDAALRAGAATEQLDQSGATPLHAAARAGQAELCAQLLRAGADIKARDARGATAREIARDAKHFALGHMLQREAIRRK